MGGESKQEAQTPVPWIQIRLVPGSNSNASSRYMTLAMADTTVCYALHSASSYAPCCAASCPQLTSRTLPQDHLKGERNEADIKSVCRCKCSSMYPPRPRRRPSSSVQSPGSTLMLAVALGGRLRACTGALPGDLGECRYQREIHRHQASNTSSPRTIWLLTGATQVNQGLHGNYRDILTTYWQQTINHLETDSHDYKLHQLPLARIKKVMKADPEVKMISAEAPILFAKGCDIFITELTMRAWIHAEENKRRTLQRSDIASALAKSDMFDFLIDIVPREEAASHAKRNTGQAGSVGGTGHPSSSSGGLSHPQNTVQQQPQPGHPQQQHHIGPPDYAGLGQHAMAQEHDYRPQSGMYATPVQPDPTVAYGQPQQQMFEGMYGYPAMPPQQVGCWFA